MFLWMIVTLLFICVTPDKFVTNSLFGGSRVMKYAAGLSSSISDVIFRFNMLLLIIFLAVALSMFMKGP